MPSVRSFLPRACLPALAACLLSAGSAPAQRPGGVGATLPDTLIRRVLDEVRAPAGFDVTVFAAPPHINYPTCLEATPAGEVYACVDPNLNFDRARRRGRIVRMVDDDQDGTADRYTIFADSLDSPRGLVVDGGTLYVTHAPTLSAMRDTDGDGVADESHVLVRGFGFGLDSRGGDHTINGLVMGIDGWLYVAVGDYGFVEAVGSDGRRLQLRGGGVVRVRPDGTEMEVYARGTRNIYDLGIDPLLNVYTRDNNNNGQGWDIRLHYLPQGSDAGYPSLFANFPEEILRPIADYGAGAGTAGLWLHDPRFPEGFGNTLFTGDWVLNRIFRHRLRPRGASFDVDQEEFLTIPRPTDIVADAASRLYVASLAGGSFTYAGERVGFIVRVTPAEKSPSEIPRFGTLSPNTLTELIASPSAVHRLAAQRELLRRAPLPRNTSTRLERMISDARLPQRVRVAAMFTLKQLAGPRAHPALLHATRDPTLRALALRALADRAGEIEKVPHAPFLQALKDPDPRVQAQAIIGLERIGAPGAAAGILPLTVSSDPVVAHLAVNALVRLEAVEVALRGLDTGSPAIAEASLRVLRRLHSPRVIGALLDRLARATEWPAREALLQSLARLYHREGPWAGEWWDVQPNTEGPYYDPTPWEESPRIEPVLERALLSAEGAELESLMRGYGVNRVLPRGADTLLAALHRDGDARLEEVIRTLTGRKALDADVVRVLTSIRDGGGGGSRAAVRMLVGQTVVSPASAVLLREAALDSALSWESRIQALSTLGRLPGRRGIVSAAEGFVALVPEVARSPLLTDAWRGFVAERRHAREIDYFLSEAEAPEADRRVVAYAVLAQIASSPRTPEAAKKRAAAAVNAAWTDPSAVTGLVRALEITGNEKLFEEQLARFRMAVPRR